VIEAVKVKDRAISPHSRTVSRSVGCIPAVRCSTKEEPREPILSENAAQPTATKPDETEMAPIGASTEALAQGALTKGFGPPEGHERRP